MKIPVPVDLKQYQDNPIQQREMQLDWSSDLENIFNRQNGSKSFGPAGTSYSPKPIFEMIPEFPEHLKKKGIQGYIKFQLLINPSGTVDSVRILENTTRNHTLERLSTRAVKKLRYEAKRIQHPLWIDHTIHYE